MADIHPTAIVSPEAQLGVGVVVGPFSVVGAGVTLEDGVKLHHHVVVEGPTRLGQGCELHPFAAVGGPAQDLKYQGEMTDLVVGPKTIIREHVTVHRGTAAGGGRTIIGAGCLLMAGAHVAHDCRVGDAVVMANQTALGGHVTVGDHAVLGAFVGIHQFSRVGELAMVAAGAMVSMDVPPFGLVQGDRARLVGINTEGLKRAGWGEGDIRAARRAMRLLLSRQPRRASPGEEEHEVYANIRAFIGSSKRGVCRFR